MEGLAKQHAAVKSLEIKMKISLQISLFFFPKQFLRIGKGTSAFWTLKNHLFVKNFLWKTDWMSRL